jgi:prepilin-type N-terminal cleavage/methylation domain-containing protein
VTERNGFTVIELLVALVIGGVVIGSLFQLLGGQGRFVEMQSAREEVQQNTRASLELIGSELRTLPGGDALVEAASDSITIRAPRVWGVVCAVGGATSFDVAFPVIAGANYTTNLGTGMVVNFGTPTAPVWSSAARVTAIGNGATTCDGSALPAEIERRTLTVATTPQNGATTPVSGDVLYLYEQVTYRTGTSAGVPGLWIQRRVGEGIDSSNQPLAGPIESNGNGLRFEYFSGSSSTALSTPITDASTRATVNRVIVVVESVSRNSLADERESKADTVIVPLRNRVL